MNDNTLKILQDIYHKSSYNNYLTLHEIIRDCGIDGYDLRAVIEDLKELGLIVEHQEGIRLSQEGLHFCRSRWV